MDEDAGGVRARALLNGPSGFVQETTVVFETSEGDTVEDDEVKHHNAMVRAYFCGLPDCSIVC